MAMARSISFYDLKNYPEAVRIMQEGSDDEILELLFGFGCDPKQGYTVRECWHRPLTTNKAVYGPRIDAFERRDPEWLRSEHCSFENKCEQIEDQSLRQELVNMSREINYHEATVNYMSVGKGNKKK